MSWKQFVQKASHIPKSSKVRLVKGSRNIECIIMQQWFVKWFICILFSPKCLYWGLINCSLFKYSSVLIFHGVWLGSHQALLLQELRQEVNSCPPWSQGHNSHQLPWGQDFLPWVAQQTRVWNKPSGLREFFLICSWLSGTKKNVLLVWHSGKIMIALNFLWPAALGRSLEAVTHFLLAKKGEKTRPQDWWKSDNC